MSEPTVGADILLVEDTSHNLQLMTYLLASHGHTVIAAVTGEQGIELALAARPDLVVMDLQLPGIDGYEALTVLRSAPELAAVPVVAVTSFAMADDRERALSAGFSHYMSKPIDPETFTEEINLRLPEHLRGSRPAPAATEPAPITDLPASGLDRCQTADILVLDDTLINQTLLRSMLEPHGYHVRTAFTVEQAIAAAHEALPDLVLSDVHVGRQTGAQLLEHVRGVPVLALVPFAFITATTDWQDPTLDGGTTRIIRRPIEPAALLDEVEALLTRRTGD